MIIVTTLARDFLPGAWDMYHPSWVEIWSFIGTIGFFLMLFLLFIRYLPVIAIGEVKAVLPESDAHGDPSLKKRSIVIPAPTYEGDLEHTGGRPEQLSSSSTATA